MWKKWFFRAQQAAGLTEKEAKAFLILGLVFALGAGARYFRKTRVPFDDDTYVALDAEFQRLSARADSMNRLWAAVPADTTGGLAQPSLDPQSSPGPQVVDLNAASANELQSLPRVGPKTADRILALRRRLGRFQSVDDLLMVQGIGEKTLEPIRELAVVRSQEHAEADPVGNRSGESGDGPVVSGSRSGKPGAYSGAPADSAEVER